MLKKHFSAIFFLLLLEFSLSLGKVPERQNTSIQEESPSPEVKTLAMELPKIEVKNLTIQEQETYQISDFIVEINSPKEIEYTYKDTKMGNYQEPGQYMIVLLFPSEFGIISKKATLTIEKKEEKEEKPKEMKEKTKPKTLSLSEQILSHNGKLGTAGRLYFSNLSSVALYEADFYQDDLQKIVDAKDSAAYFLYYDKVLMIADHSIQGFDIIKKQKVGNVAYRKVKNAEGNVILEKYQVMEKVEGTNTGTHLITKDGRKVEETDASLVMYTCNSSNPRNVTIVLWKKA